MRSGHAAARLKGLDTRRKGILEFDRDLERRRHREADRRNVLEVILSTIERPPAMAMAQPFSKAERLTRTKALQLRT